jgi:hypothetical protein
MNDLLIVVILAFSYSIFSFFIELLLFGIEDRVALEIKRLELNKEMKKYKNDPEKIQEIFSEMMKLNNEMMFNINRLKAMLITGLVFMFIMFFVILKIPEKTLITIPILNIGLNPFWSFFALYFIFMFVQNIIVMKLLVKKYGKTST